MSWGNASKEILGGDESWNELENLLRKVPWLNDGMTTPPTPMDHREGPWRDFPLLSNLASSSVALAEREGFPRGRRAGLLHLYARARNDPSAAVGLLGLLAPELSSMCRHLVRQGTEPGDAEADVVAIAWEVVLGRRRRPQRPSPRRLADAIWNEVRRESGLRRRRQLELSPWPAYLDPPEPESDHLDRWPGLLAAAVAASILTPRQVVVVAETRMEGRSMPEMAKRLGRPVGALYKERQRAEESLRAFALSYDWSSS